MAINWSAGLISAGGSMKQYSAMLLKEEYMAEEKAAAAQTGLMGRYSTLLDTVTDSISDNTTEMGRIIDPERQESLYTYQNVLMNALQTGKQIPATTLQAMAEEVAKGGTPEVEDKSGFFSAIGGFFSAAAEDLTPELKKVQDWLKSNVDKDDVVMGARGAVYKGSPEELEKALGNASKKIQAIKDWWASITFGADRLEEEQPANIEGADPSLQATYEDPFGVGLIEKGIRYTDEDTAQEMPGGGVSEEPPLESEIVNGIPQTGIGSEATTRSLFEDVGGPIGEPAGKTTVRDFVIGKPEVEIEISPPEIEERKSTILSNVFSAIRDTESNVMGYSAVADTTDGDRGLTTSTVGEIVNKHGNKAIGIGQFKFNEFMKPTAKKWFGMSEAQLKDQMFTPQFQDALVVAGLYDAGLQQFADGKIDAATFQKRIANIWRGLPPDKDTKEGDPTDDLGNKARMSGEELRGLIEQGMTGQ